MPNDSFNNPLIVWEKWVDPFGEDMDEAQWQDYDDDEGEIADQQEVMKNKKSIKVISSPMGLIPYNEHTSSAKIFNFWVGHTNFNITKTVANKIELCEGVEILDIFTRYRFRIAVGKCFNDSDVMNNIQNIVSSFMGDETNDQQ